MTASCLFSAINISIKASYEKCEPFLKEYLFALGSDLICERALLLKGAQGNCLCLRLIVYGVGRREKS